MKTNKCEYKFYLTKPYVDVGMAQVRHREL